MKVLYELDGQNYDTVTELNPMCPAFWRYRKKITVECLSLKFQEYSQGCDEADKCEVLAEFLKKVGLRNQINLSYRNKEWRNKEME